jgi:hypothetical protein
MLVITGLLLEMRKNLRILKEVMGIDFKLTMKYTSVDTFDRHDR